MIPWQQTVIEKKTNEFVNTRYQKMAERRKKNEKRWEDSEESYLAPFQSNDQYESDINLPVEFTHIQHAHAEIVDSPPRIIFTPKNKNGADKVEIAQAVWDYAWEKAGTDRQIFWWFLYLLTLGSCVWYEGYKVVYKKKFTKMMVSEEDVRDMDIPLNLVNASDEFQFGSDIPQSEEEVTGDGYKESEEVEYDDVYGENVPLKEFFIDEAAKTFWEPTHTNDARDCLRERYLTVEQFLESYCRYDRIKKLKDTTVDSTFRSSELTTQTGAKIKVREYYSRILQRKIIQVNDTYIINGENGEPNPFDHGRMPFTVTPCFPIFGSPYGLGMPDLLRGLRAQESLVMNIGVDQGKSAIQPPLIKSSGMAIQDEQMYAGMGYMLSVQGDINDIKELPIGQLSNNFFTILDRLEQYEILGTGQDVRALIKSEPTAFQQANKKEVSLKRLKLILQSANWEGLQQIAQMRYANMRQAYSLPDIESAIGRDLDGSGEVERPKRTIRVKNKQVLQQIGPDGITPDGIKFEKIDGYTDFFELEPDDLEDYDLSIEFVLNTSKELRKLRFQEAINTAPVILKIAQANVFDPAGLLEFWADVYELPQTLINKGVDTASAQVPLNMIDQKQDPGTQMQPQTPSAGSSVEARAQQGFNLAQPQLV